MKRLAIFLAVILAFSACMLQPVFAEEQTNPIKVFVDGIPVTFDVQPTIRNDRTLVPFRAIAEALNISVTWDGAARIVKGTDGKTAIELQIDNKTAKKGDSSITLDAAPTIIGNRTLIPLRFFSEAFGCGVKWDGTVREVKIASPVKDITISGFYGLGSAGNTSSWEDLFGKPYPDTAEGHTDVVSDLALCWYTMDQEGNLITNDTVSGWRMPGGADKLAEAAGKYKLKTEMAVLMKDKNSAIFNLTNNDAAMAKAVKNITDAAKQYGGVDIDFEGLGWNDTPERLALVKDSFTKFIEQLSIQLRKSNLSLTLSLHAPNSAYKGYDYQALGKLVDRIVIMAYDYNPKPAPEPDSKVIEAVETALKSVPAEKLLLGINANSETADTISTKVGIAKKYKLKGIAIWRLGLVSDNMWTELGKTVKALKE